MSLCLVTGGAGFLGSHLTEALLREGHQVRVLDNLSTGSQTNIVHVRDQIDWHLGDLADPEAVRDAVRDVEIVFHLAGNPSVSLSVLEPLKYQRTIVEGTLSLLTAAREAGVQRVVYTSSCQVYSGNRQRRLREASSLYPATPYAVATLAAEHFCRSYSNLYGLETVRLRCFNVIGPRQAMLSRNAALTPQLMQAMLAGNRPVLFGDGLQGRDFVSVRDAVQAHVLAGWNPRASGKVYNIGSGRRVTPIEVVTHLNTLLETALSPIHLPERQTEPLHLVADTSLAETELGYCPTMNIEQSLAACIDYYAAQRKGPKFLRYGRTPLAAELAWQS